MKSSEYFSHDYNARNDEKLLKLRSEYGWEGYGVFWGLIEMMAENEGRISNDPAIISLALGVEKGWLEGWLEAALNLGLIKNDNETLYAPRLEYHLKLRKKLKEAGKKGGSREKTSHPKPSPQANKSKSKVKENKKPPKGGTKMPEWYEFLNYAEEKAAHLGLDLSESKLQGKYEAWKTNGWKTGNDRPIKNWKSTLLNTLPYLQKEKGSDQKERFDL